MDFSTAPTEQMGGGGVIPDKTLAWAWIKVRPFNIDQGLIETPSKSSTAKFLDCELTILEGPFAKRKVFTRIGRGGGNNPEVYMNMGNAALRAILEVGQGASAQNPAGYQIDDDYGQLWDSTRGQGGMKCAIKIKIEPARDGYDEKNDVAAFLSPNPESNTCKEFQKLLDGDTAGVTPPQSAANGNAAPAWGGTSAPTGQPTGGPAATPPANPTEAQPSAGTPAAAASSTTKSPSDGKPSWL